MEDGEIQSERHGHDPDTTNNRMEFQALIEAFKMLPEENRHRRSDRQPSVCEHDHELGARLGAERVEEEVRPHQEPGAS